MATKKPVKKAAAKAPAKKAAAPAPKPKAKVKQRGLVPVIKTTKSGQRYVERKLI